jgi:hypothetical protein
MTLPALDLDYPLVTPEPALTVCPSLVPAPDNDPFTDVLALAADHRARLLAAVPTLIRLARSEAALSRQLVDLSGHLAGLVVAAATVGLAVIGHDPRADLLGALDDAFTLDITRLTVAAGLDRIDADHLLALALEAHS